LEAFVFIERKAFTTKEVGSGYRLAFPCKYHPCLLLFAENHVFFVTKDTKTSTKQDAELINPATGQLLKFDIYLPSLKLGFEFQVLFFTQVSVALSGT